MKTPVDALVIQRFEEAVVSYWTALQDLYANQVVYQLQQCTSLDEKRRVVNDCLMRVRYESVREPVGGSWDMAEESPEWAMWKAAVASACSQ